jgi:hypothetical protein
MSSIPDPATTDWVPLQGVSGGLAYWGTYDNARTYNDGDMAIGADGVLYVCTTNGTVGSPPVAWPGASAPQGAAGPQGPVGTGIPMPVTNGQWIKGVGGAAVWSPLLATDVPGLVVADSGWTIPTLVNGSHYGAPFGPARYRKLASGMVICDGLITAGAAGTVHIQFPVGYRPDPNAGTRQLIFVTANSAAANIETWRLDLDGGLRSWTSMPVSSWVSISGVQFFAT